MRYVKRLKLIDDGIYEPPISNGKVRYSSGKETDVKVLWDTGCTNTTISESVANYLEAEISDEKISVESVKGKDVEGTCHIDIDLYTDNDNYAFSVYDMKVLVSTDMNMDVLLGMDIIGQGDFSLTKHLDYLTLEFSF